MVTIAAACAATLELNWWRSMLAGINIVAFIYYGFDKYRAVRGGWRVPEALLLCFAAAGGAAGSLLGQIVFNHKTARSRFRRIFWIIVMLQVAAFMGLVVMSSGS